MDTPPTFQHDTEFGDSVVVVRDGNHLLFDIANQDGQFRSHWNREDAIAIATAILVNASEPSEHPYDAAVRRAKGG